MIKVYFYTQDGEKKMQHAYEIKGDFYAVKERIKELGGMFESLSKSWAITKPIFEILDQEFETTERVSAQKVAQETRKIIEASKKIGKYAGSFKPGCLK